MPLLTTSSYSAPFTVARIPRIGNKTCATPWLSTVFLRVFFIGGSFLYAARSSDRDEGDHHFNFYKIRDIPQFGDEEFYHVIHSREATDPPSHGPGDGQRSAAGAS